MDSTERTIQASNLCKESSDKGKSHDQAVPDLYYDYTDADEDLAGALSTKYLEHSAARTSVKLFGDYELLEVVGSWGVGVVYRAFERSTSIQVAIKTIPPCVFATKREIERFRREVKVLEQLSHPAIVQYKGLIQQEGQFGLVMEWIEGTSVQELLDENGPFGVNDAARIMGEL